MVAADGCYCPCVALCSYTLLPLSRRYLCGCGTKLDTEYSAVPWPQLSPGYNTHDIVYIQCLCMLLVHTNVYKFICMYM